MANLADIFRLAQPEAGDESAVASLPIPPPFGDQCTGSDDAEAIVEVGRARSNVEARLRMDAPISGENEKLQHLVLHTRQKIDELDAIKQAFDDMMEPLGAAMHALDDERLLTRNLAGQLDEKTAGYEKACDALYQAEKKIRQFESETENLQGALDHARAVGRALESRQVELGDEINRRGGQIGELERQLEQETARRRNLDENCRALQEHVDRAEKRIAELQGNLTASQEKCALLDDDRRSLRNSLDQALGEIARLNRRLNESESTAASVRADLGKLEASYAEMSNERSRLAAFLDELSEQRQAECQMLNERIAALQSRAAAAERLVAETRKRLIARTEEARAFICKAAEAAIARGTAERQLAELEVLQGRRVRQAGESERARTALSEFLRALNMTSQEMSLAGANEKLAALSDRHGRLEADSRAMRSSFSGRSEVPNPAFDLDRGKRTEIETALDAARKDNERLEDEIANLRTALRGSDNAAGVQSAPTVEENAARLAREEATLVQEIEARALSRAASRNGVGMPESLFTSRPRRSADPSGVGRKSSAA
jgi:crescentin